MSERDSSDSATRERRQDMGLRTVRGMETGGDESVLDSLERRAGDDPEPAGGNDWIGTIVFLLGLAAVVALAWWVATTL